MAKDFTQTAAAPTSFQVPSFDSADTRASSGLYATWGKRVFDVAFVLATMVLTLPLVLILAAVVATDGHNPFYRQTRVGKDGKRFTLWKLRSMVVNADALLEAHLAANPEARAEWDQYQKLRNDPRITRVGHFIRRVSLDELPQFLNVLTGDMSVVGPRPMLPNQMSIYPGIAYYALRPGVTGSWQVSDRNEAEFKARARLDTEYAQELSFATDLRLIGQTIRSVLRATGL